MHVQMESMHACTDGFIKTEFKSHPVCSTVYMLVVDIEYASQLFLASCVYGQIVLDQTIV